MCLRAFLILSLASLACTVMVPHRAPDSTDASRVRDAFLHAWRGYELHAFGHDEVRPTTNATNDSWGGFGVTLIVSEPFLSPWHARLLPG
jgi:hypothetical protein